MIRVEATGEHQTLGRWEAHRTFLGRWIVHWIDSEQVIVHINLPDGAYIRGCGCASEKRCA